MYFFRRTAEILGAKLVIHVAPTPKEYLTLQKEQLGLLVAIWAYSSSIEHHEKIKESGYFTQELSLDINYWSPTLLSILTIQLLVVFLTFVQWPTTVRAKELTSRQKQKDSWKNLFDAKRTFFILISFAVRLFFLPWGYSSCRESFSFCGEVFLFALRFFFLSWGFSFYPEVNSFPVTGGWATLPLSTKILDFFQLVGVREN